MTHPIVEAGARAIFTLEFDDESDAWDKSPFEQEDYRSMSTACILAALRAMRKPSKAVQRAAYRGAELDERATYFMRGWRAGIDALIKEIEG